MYRSRQVSVHGLNSRVVDHQPLSVFRHVEAFKEADSVVKTPTLVCDNRTVLLDSTLILGYAEALAKPRTLRPLERDTFQRDLTYASLVWQSPPARKAFKSCTNTCYVFRKNFTYPGSNGTVDRCLRPAMPWNMIWTDILALKAGSLYQRGITAAVAWHFIQAMTPDAVPAGRCPALQGFSEEAEKVPAFQAAFHGDGICQPAGMKTSQE